MGYKVENPAKFWEGGAGGSGALGSIKWQSDLVGAPDGYIRCDGTSYGNFADTVDFRTRTNLQLGAFRSIRTTYSWWYSGATIEPLGRNSYIYGGYFGFLNYNGGSGFLSITRRQLMQIPGSNTEPLSTITLGGGIVLGWKVFTDTGDCLIIGTSNIYFFKIDQPSAPSAAAATPVALATGNQSFGGSPERFLGKYYVVVNHATNQGIHVSNGPGSWGTWNKLTLPPETTLPAGEITAGKIGNQDVLAVVCTNGDLLTFDGTSWSLDVGRFLFARYNVNSLADTYMRLCFDGEDTWYLLSTLLTSSTTQESVWKSTDLVTWTPMGFVGNTTDVRRASAIDASQGTIVVGKNYVAADLSIVSISFDKGDNWQHIFPGTNGNSPPFQGISCNSAYMVTYQGGSADTAQCQIQMENGHHAPAIPPLLFAPTSETYRAYIRIE